MHGDFVVTWITQLRLSSKVNKSQSWAKPLKVIVLSWCDISSKLNIQWDIEAQSTSLHVCSSAIHGWY